MGKAVDCGRERTDWVLEAFEKVESRLVMYELARSNLAFDGGEVKRGGSEVRFTVGDVPIEAGSLLGDITSAAMAAVL